MASPTLGILGQASPAAATDTPLYTVPAARRAVVSTIVIANTAATATAFRVHAQIAGAAAAAGNALFYDVPLNANTTVTVTIGAALATTDELGVYATDAGVTFTCFGEESDVPA